MKKTRLPVAPVGHPCAGVSCEPAPSALERWDGGIKAASTDDNSISVLMLLGRIIGERALPPNGSLERFVR